MEMNVQLHHVVSNIAGETGMRIVRAIVAGDRDPMQLAQQPRSPLQGERRDDQGRAGQATTAKSTSLRSPRRWSSTTDTTEAIGAV